MAARVCLLSSDSTKFWQIERDGTTVTTRSGKVGEKGRSSTKSYPSEDKAIAAVEKAQRAKVLDGYLPENLDEIPMPAVNPPEIADRLRAVTLPVTALRDTVPEAYARLRQDWGVNFVDGPRGYNLWFPENKEGVEAMVGRGGDVRHVEPRLIGKKAYHDSFGLWFTGHPIFGDRQMAIAVDETLWTLDLETATAAKLHAFDGVDALREHLPVVWAADGCSLLGLRNACVCRISPAGVEPVLELRGRAPTAILPLADGRHAVLQPERLTVFRVDGTRAIVTHTIECRQAQAIGIWQRGSVLLVLGEQDGESCMVAWAVADGELYPMTRSAKRYKAAYDVRGGSFTVDAAGATMRIFNVEHVRDVALKGTPIASETVIARRTLHDVIIEALRNDIETDLDDVIASVDLGIDATYEAFGTRSTPLAYSLLRAGRGDARAKQLVRRLVEAGADVDLPTAQGMTPLALAYQAGLLEIVPVLLDAGALREPPRTALLDGATVTVASVLPYAAAAGYYEQVEGLLASGVDIDRTDHEGVTALARALAGGHHDLALMLIDRGATCDEAIFESAVRGKAHPEAVRAVVARVPEVARTELGTKMLGSAALSASVNPDDLEVPGILSAAGARNTSPACISYLIDAGLADVLAAQLAAGADPNGMHSVANAPSHPLHRALSRKNTNIDVVRALLEAGADANLVATNGRAPLTYAVSWGVEIVGLLLEHGAKVARGDFAWGPMHAAAAQNQLEVLQELHRAGGDLEEVCADGMTPLGHAAVHARIEIAQWLLSQGVDVDGGDFTALMAAARANKAELVDRLLAAGADPTREGQRGAKGLTGTAHAHAVAARATETAAKLATVSDGMTLVTVLDRDAIPALEAMLAGGASASDVLDDTGRRPLHAARSAAAIRLLVAAGANVEAADTYGNTPLQFAAARPDGLDCVRALIDAGADPNGGDRVRWRPAQRAAGAGNLEILKLLVEAGAKLDARLATTPLHSAAEGGHLECVRWLIAQGSEVVGWDEGPVDGRKSPLHLAAAGGHLDVIEALLVAGARPDDRASEPNNFDFGGRTAVHDAARRGKLDALIVLLRNDRGGAHQQPSNNGWLPIDEAKEHPDVHAFLDALGKRGATVDGWLRAREADIARAERLKTRGGFWIERLARKDWPRTPSIPEAVAKARGSGDEVRVGATGTHCLVLRAERGLMRLACGDAEGIHTVAEAPRASFKRAAAHPDGHRFLATDATTVYEIDAATRTARKVLESDGDIDDLVYAGELVLLRRGEAIVAVDAEGTTKWTLDAKDVFAWVPTGTAVIAIKPRANVLGVVWYVAAQDGLRLVGRHLEKVDHVHTSVHEGRRRTIAVGLVGKDWDVERPQELHGLSEAEGLGDPIVGFPADQAALRVLAEVEYVQRSVTP